MKKINRILPLLFLILISLSISSFVNIKHQQKEDSILGKWEEESSVRTIEIYKSGDEYFGKILTNKHQDEDQLTPGTIMMDGFVFNKDEDNWQGKVVIPSKDMVLNGKIILENENQIKSFAKIAFISKSKIWNRIK
ncbi:hypothetical protein A5893_01565 [Pedobacter psychrophilus]|uniref:DUF2147 domain-containing protein n=1 Tax=Pedobacter psychrophilus TaxID=1826909 RepID=A0A179DLD6_9SPHI|nr:DUF2147 domain-containing protein [Pedobacter psychrophilus]OAQ41831.1 hypothetical protein A5893_01565 [Pedobacter psychrophilus]